MFRSGQNRYVKCLWKEVHVGDIVRLSCDEMIPADILGKLDKCSVLDEVFSLEI